ncbi:D-alanine-D-alanine ligase [Catenuloplanes nepalensis]|uniref:D-alanine-D-alanine ligase n=1 Tax=Catenuloplanes nepalensis TaxID=587533 RepID=A0ABT9N0H0_9ACTN|nr:hypothetical protein [Catenuloplanes nepalensis]MDP9797199.1 D-alanine-D-alanine ligase [Catenuloplanes nepalensis]
MAGSRKTRVAVVAGERSSAGAIADALDPVEFEVVPVEIARTGLTPLKHADVVLPLPHDGDATIPGLLEMAGIPFVGAGVLAAAVAANRSFTRRLAASAGLPVVTPDAAGFPVVSAGVGEDGRPQPGAPSASTASARRFTCAVLVDEAGEPGVAHPSGAPDAVPALARAAFTALGCTGPVTVTALVTPAGAVLLDEIDATPDLRPGAPFARMWADAGLAYPALVTRLIRTALGHGSGLH